MSDEALEFSTEDVVIDADGRVIIDNPEFAKKLIGRITDILPEQAKLFDNCPVNTNTQVNLKSAMPSTKLTLDIETRGFFDNCPCSK